MLSFCIATGDDPEADSKTDENNYAEPQSGVAKQKTVANKAKVKNKPAASANEIICAGCGEVITSDRVIEYSVAKFGHPLCMDCQKQANRAAQEVIMDKEKLIEILYEILKIIIKK